MPDAINMVFLKTFDPFGLCDRSKGEECSMEHESHRRFNFGGNPHRIRFRHRPAPTGSLHEHSASYPAELWAPCEAK